MGNTCRSLMASASILVILVLVSQVSGCSGAESDETEAAATALDALLAGYRADAPGCAVGVLHDGSVRAAKAYGLANVELNVPLTTHSSFHLASVSKQFTALSILLLEQEGKLQLDDGIRRYVPELPSYADEITLRQLLHHTSGLREYERLGWAAGYPRDYVWTERGMLAMLVRQQHLLFPPGTAYSYAGSGYFFLALVAQRVTGRSLNDWARERIFLPLHMSDTRFQHDHALAIPNRATGYSRQETGWRIENYMDDAVGPGGVYSTLEDMLKWAANFDDQRLWLELLARMGTVGALNDGTPLSSGYGMGLVRLTMGGLEVVRHGGSGAGYRTAFLHLPSEKASVVVLCNNADADVGQIATRVAELYVGQAMSPAEAVQVPVQPTEALRSGDPVPAELRRALAGQFYNPELDSTYEILVSGDNVLLQFGAWWPIAELLIVGPNRLRLAAYRGGPDIDTELELERDVSGGVTGFSMIRNNLGPTFEFTRK